MNSVLHKSIDQDMKKCSYDDEQHVPVANEKNRNILKEIDAKTKLKTSLNAQLETIVEHVYSLKKHAQNAALVHNYNQQLLNAHSMQLDSEEHLSNLCNATYSRLHQDTREFSRKRKHFSDQLHSKEIELNKYRATVESLKENVEFHTDQLWRWEEALSQGKIDNELIQTYIKQDTKKFENFELTRKARCIEVSNWKCIILRYVNEVLEFENVLNRTAALYEKLWKERHQLMKQWSKSALVLNQRDYDIHKIIKETDQLQDYGRERLSFLQDAEEFIGQITSDNKELAEFIQKLEQKLAALKTEHSTMLNDITTYSCQVHLHKNILANIGGQIQNLRAEKIQLNAVVEKTSDKIRYWNKQIDDLNRTLGDVHNQRKNIANRPKQLDYMIKKEEKFQDMVIRETDHLNGFTERRSQQIVNFGIQATTIALKAQGEKEKIKSFNCYLAKTENILNEMQEAIYNSYNTVQNCEIKFRRLDGQEYDEDLVKKTEKSFQNLQKVFQEKSETCNALQLQMASLQMDVKMLSSCIVADETEFAVLNNKKQTQILLMEGGVKQVYAHQARIHDKQVNENILRLRISHASHTISNIDDSVFDLEKHKHHLHMKMKERKAEIKFKEESLSLSHRVAVAGVLDTRLAISERKCRKVQLRAKHETLMSLLGTTAEGSPLTVTFIKIKSAQDKFALQEQGDQLDKLIRQTEYEIESMENTLRIVNACNDEYKRSLKLIGVDDPEETEQKKLSEIKYFELENIRSKKCESNNITCNMKVVERDLQGVLVEIELATEEQVEKQRHLNVLERQIKEQLSKQSRAKKSRHMVYKDCQNIVECTEDNSIPQPEKDIAVRNLQEQNGHALQHLTELMTRHAEVEPYIRKLLAHKSMTLPCTNYLKSASSTSRCQSSRNSHCAK